MVSGTCWKSKILGGVHFASEQAEGLESLWFYGNTTISAKLYGLFPEPKTLAWHHWKLQKCFQKCWTAWFNFRFIAVIKTLKSDQDWASYLNLWLVECKLLEFSGTYKFLLDQKCHNHFMSWLLVELESELLPQTNKINFWVLVCWLMMKA